MIKHPYIPLKGLKDSSGMTFGRKFRDYVNWHGLSVNEIHRRSGISRTAIGNYLNEAYTPDWARAEKLVDAVGYAGDVYQFMDTSEYEVWGIDGVIAV